MLSTTLTSLAMLKVNIDQGKDYLDYLRPFILQILVDEKPDPVTDQIVCGYLRAHFGLEIPQRAVQLVLKRLSRHKFIEKETGIYRITGQLPNPGIAAEKSKAERHIQSVVSGLMEFSKYAAMPIGTDDEAVTALLAFLSQFNIPCLKAYLRGSAIPTIEGNHDIQIVLVSQYVLHLQRTDPERFDSFLILLQGHMLANALMCPDLQQAPKTYQGVTFYLDTPLLVRRLGLEGEPKAAAIRTMISLLLRLGASVASFSHSREELERVISGAADYVNNRNGYGAIVMEARRSGRTKSDLLMLIGRIDERLAEAQIEVKQSPRYIKGFQIDETAFEQVLQDEVSYYNPRAKDYDINSVRSIYVLRAGTTPTTVERSKAVLVTSNSGFARAAFEYGQRHEESCEVSSVITDFSLANMAWLKAPMGAPSLPKTEILAFAYAALQPSRELLSKYLMEIERLEREGKITARDHQFLRSSDLAQKELMYLTLGDEEALTEETIVETLQRAENEIKREESEKFDEEQIAHRKTQDQLALKQAKMKKIQEQLYWRCALRAKQCSWIITGIVVGVSLIGFAAGLGLKSSVPVLGWILTAGFGLMMFLSLIEMLVGYPVREMHKKLRECLLRRYLRQEEKAMGFTFGNNE